MYLSHQKQKERKSNYKNLLHHICFMFYLYLCFCFPVIALRKRTNVIRVWCCSLQHVTVLSQTRKFVCVRTRKPAIMDPYKSVVLVAVGFKKIKPGAPRLEKLDSNLLIWNTRRKLKSQTRKMKEKRCRLMIFLKLELRWEFSIRPKNKYNNDPTFHTIFYKGTILTNFIRFAGDLSCDYQFKFYRYLYL